MGGRNKKELTRTIKEEENEGKFMGGKKLSRIKGGGIQKEGRNKYDTRGRKGRKENKEITRKREATRNNAGIYIKETTNKQGKEETRKKETGK